MKRFASIIFILFLVLPFSGRAKNYIDDVSFKTVRNHIFMVVKLPENVQLEYGTKVELVFGYNKVLTLYNVNTKALDKLHEPNTLTAFVLPENLRCFERKKLKKIRFLVQGKRVVIKPNMPPHQIFKN